MTEAPGALPPGQPRAALVSEVRQRLAQLRDGAVVAVACSGGPDSTALAFLAGEARPDLDLTLVHVRHGLRDDAIDRGLVERHASWLGAGFVTRDVEVRPGGHGMEAAARDGRYAALREAAAGLRAVSILVGHTADDQAETLLFRLARGTGLDGLAGMSPVRDDLTRPLLRLRRADVRRFVVLEGLPVVEDPSNRDPTVRRAMVRHELLPVLERLAPDPVGALARLAELARDDAAALDVAAEELRRAVRWTGPIASLPVQAVAAAPPALARRVVREVLVRLVGRPPSAAVVARVLGAEPGSGTSLPDGIELTLTGSWLALAPRQLPTADEHRLEIPGLTQWEPAGVAIRATGPDADDQQSTSAQQLGLDLPGVLPSWRPRRRAGVAPPGAAPDRLWLLVPAELPALFIRARRPGDRIRTAGGTRSVADVLAGAGVPRPVREVWPLVTAGTDVVWLPGFAVDRELLAAGRAAPTVVLTLVAGTDGRPVPTGTR